MATTSFVESFRPRRISIFTAMLSLFVILLIIGFDVQYSDEYASMESKHKFNSRTTVSASHRKLLQRREELISVSSSLMSLCCSPSSGSLTRGQRPSVSAEFVYDSVHLGGVASAFSFCICMAPPYAAKGVEEPNRISGGRLCSSGIVINQGPTAPLPNGIPAYLVEITNVCVSGCSISSVHLHCGWFSSARFINPRIFKRLRYDDCLVNGGKPLPGGLAISFTYANTFPYKLSVASGQC